MVKKRKFYFLLKPKQLKISYLLFSFLFLIVVINTTISQEVPDQKQYRVMFYNVENLFDIKNDSLTNDDEFTPDGMRHWDNRKFYQKINNIYKVIISVGEWQPPALVGLCEVENRYVLNKLVYQTPLKKYDYKIIHEESPESRGIDVALIYRPDLFQSIYSEKVSVKFSTSDYRTTRDILYVKGVLGDNDTIHVFVNHWPSRYGGYLVSKPKREIAAGVLRTKVDSVFNTQNFAKILIMGDFNDEPFDESLSGVLNAKADTTGMVETDLFNLMFSEKGDWNSGSHKYREDWTNLDQLIVSKSLINSRNGMVVSDKGARIYKADFLLEEDKTHLGVKPFRTYIGMKYNGGFSDHLPVYLDLIISPQKEIAH